jgi:hypothetical protein
VLYENVSNPHSGCALDNILTGIMCNSHFGKRLGARDMTIFESHVGPHVLHIAYITIYTRIWSYIKVKTA